MRRTIARWLVAAAFSAFLSACGREEARSDIELTAPATTAEMETAFGPAVTEAVEADADGVPRDPKAEDVAPVSFTTEPLPVSAD